MNMCLKSVCTILTAVGIVAGTSAATTWYVDATNGNDENAGTNWELALATIQKAVDSASAHDTILVSRGIYSYIDIPGSKIGLTVSAIDGPAETTIKGADYRRCVTIGDGSVTNIYIEGFTLTEAKKFSRDGAGALGGTYNNCIITGNYILESGSAAGASKCTLNGCTISNNFSLSSHSVGAAGIVNCIARNCVIVNNEMREGYGSGGAQDSVLIECKVIGNRGHFTSQNGFAGGACNCTLFRCLLADNTKGSGQNGSEMNGGTAYDCIIITESDHSITRAQCYNCTIVSEAGSPSIGLGTTLYNCVVSSSGDAFVIKGKADLKNCLLNNVSLDNSVSQIDCVMDNPLFVGNSDYHLQADSPCIDRGNNSYARTTIDFSGNKRIRNGKVDIGAYEYIGAYGSNVHCAVSAKQRYPWNGKVDLQFTIEGDVGAMNRVSLSAKDMVGDTNIVMRTIRKANGSTVNVDGESVVQGTYNWVWDAAADLPDGFECNRVTVTGKAEETRGKVQLWEGGPYWATTNIGANEPWESGYYFWWGDTVGYWRENDKWVASDGSSANYSFGSSTTPTYDKSIATLKSEGWITADEVLAPEHDAAQTHWGGGWRLPTNLELRDLNNKCDWIWTTLYDVQGYVVKGKGVYASASIFLPCAGLGNETSLYFSGSYGYVWSSVPYTGNIYAYVLYFNSGNYSRGVYYRNYGLSVRPVQGFAK